MMMTILIVYEKHVPTNPNTNSSLKFLFCVLVKHGVSSILIDLSNTIILNADLNALSRKLSIIIGSSSISI